MILGSVAILVACSVMLVMGLRLMTSRAHVSDDGNARSIWARRLLMTSAALIAWSGILLIVIYRPGARSPLLVVVNGMELIALVIYAKFLRRA